MYINLMAVVNIMHNIKYMAEYWCMNFTDMHRKPVNIYCSCNTIDSVCLTFQERTATLDQKRTTQGVSQKLRNFQ